MKQRNYILVLAALLLNIMTLKANAQSEDRVCIEGHVFDKTTKEAIAYASVALEGTKIGTTTDEEGNFIFRSIAPGRYTIVVSCIGYKKEHHTVEVRKGSVAHAHLELVPEATRLDEIVVSANRNETNRKEAPVVVNVLSEKQFEQNNAQDLVQSLGFQSGVRVEYNCQNCGFPQVRINGLEGPYTQLLIDSKPIMSALSGVYGLEQIPVNMVERIEVVKGGGSALFGANAIAGTVNIITKEPLSPSLSVGTDVQAIGGTTYSQNFNANGAILSKDRHFGASFYQTFRKRNPYDRDNDGFSEIGMLTNNSFGTKLFYNINSKNKIKIEYHTTNEKRRGGNNFDMQPHYADICEATEHLINALSLNYDFVSSDGKHRLNVYSSAQSIDRNSYYGSHKDPNAYGITNDLTFLAGAMANHYLDKFLFSKASITYGAEYSTNRLDDQVKAYNIRTQQNVSTIGMYVQSEWTSRYLNLLIGARMDKHNLLSSPVLVPRLSLLYKYNDSWQVRASYSSGYRAPQAYDEDFDITQVGGMSLRTKLADNLNAEYSNSFSLSSDHYAFLGENWQANLLIEGFYTILNDVFATRIIEQDTINNIIYQERYNASGADVAGVSLSAKLAYKDLVTFSLGYTLQTSKYKQTEYWSDDESVEGTDYLLRSPEDYGFFSMDISAIRNTNITLGGTYTGKMKVAHYAGYIEQDRLETTPRFFDLNAAISYDIKAGKGLILQLKCGVNNILDSFQNDFDQGADRDAGYIYGPTQPRTFYIGAKLKLK
ncbi:MAG: TonB-dependent receptor [Candidatus Onthomorpha sp.]|nr:TonB-dependent receptor [Candidatus Onthomorpha sp.]